jgi:4-aminobutyrate aminotransferase-like enzyme
MLKSIENFEYFDDIINAAYLHAKLHYLEDKYGNDLIDFYNKIEISDSFVFKLN